ncbi:hypothetical protein [Gaetbulibacter saemankumensis]|uniref:hypothetical protein n=1 Tax=Gaetbulibacter saemankumensis TaxID=311208 RepID=UPI0004056FCE|nr:hypothetical protein [Gaetbulibacter saemankumensis]
MLGYYKDCASEVCVFVDGYAFTDSEGKRSFQLLPSRVIEVIRVQVFGWNDGYRFFSNYEDFMGF